jgi:uncharacterized membrane protein HdeD (DUF308 family)
MMLVLVTQNWWVMLLRGLIAITFGILALFLPGAALAGLVLVFGAFSFADGILAVWSALSMRRGHATWWLLLLEGLTGIALGLVVVLWPAMTALVLILFIAAWAFVTGIFEIWAAIKLRRDIPGEWILALTGVLSVVMGILLVLWPGPGLLALIWIIAVYAILFGGAMVALSFRLRRLHHTASS